MSRKLFAVAACLVLAARWVTAQDEKDSSAVRKEIAILATLRPELKKLPAPAGADALSPSILPQALWSAADECKWQLAALTANFPALCKRCGVVGMADADGYVPKLVFSMDGGGSFQVVFDQWNFFDSSQKPYLNKPKADNWKLETTDQRTYLVLDRPLRQRREQGV